MNPLLAKVASQLLRLTGHKSKYMNAIVVVMKCCSSKKSLASMAGFEIFIDSTKNGEKSASESPSKGNPP